MLGRNWAVYLYAQELAQDLAHKGGFSKCSRLEPFGLWPWGLGSEKDHTLMKGVLAWNNPNLITRRTGMPWPTEFSTGKQSRNPHKALKEMF